MFAASFVVRLSVETLKAFPSDVGSIFFYLALKEYTTGDGDGDGDGDNTTALNLGNLDRGIGYASPSTSTHKKRKRKNTRASS